jgi:hypothetical protein
MWDVLAAVLVFGFGIITGRLSMSRFGRPILVEEFHIEEVEKDGFSRLNVKLEDTSRKVHTYEFHPAHAHQFSDALLRGAAHAMAPNKKG